MSEGIEKAPTQKPYTLRKAIEADVPFLFNVSSQAMKEVREALDTPEKSEEERFNEYREKFVPEAIQIIQRNGEDVGRLRVVRSPESIYVGGIQILPQHQGEGIGTAIFTDLIEESNRTELPIVLEVHDVNTRAVAFYKDLGFQEEDKINGQTVMRYLPNK